MKEEEKLIQEINPRLDNQYKNIKAQSTDKVLIYHDNDIFIKEDQGQINFPTVDEILAITDTNDLRYYFSIGADNYFGFEMTDAAISKLQSAMEPSGFTWHRMFSLRSMCPQDRIMAAATGWHLHTWYRANRFCGVCGKPTIHDHKLRMVKCPACGNMIFPKLLPAVIVGVRNGDHIMLTKYRDREYTRYALIAGFVEIGESVEATVAREVMEEVGLKVKNITYYKSQPWGFDGDILMGYFCDVDGDVEITMDESELSKACWMHYSQVPEYDNLSLTSEMMKYFRHNQ